MKTGKLILACEDLSKVLELVEKIPAENKDQMKADLEEAAKLLDCDTVSKLENSTISTLRKLAIVLPKFTEKEKPKEKSKTEKEPTTEEKSVKEKLVAKKSIFGHKIGTVAAQLDDLFHHGTTIEEAVENLECSKGRINSHLKHLEKVKKLIVHRDEKTKVIKVKSA